MAIIRRAPVSENVSNSRIVVSVALIIALAAIIGWLMWVKRRIRVTAPVIIPLEYFLHNDVQPQKGIERYMLESIPVIAYSTSLESEEQGRLSNTGDSAGGGLGKGLTVQTQVAAGELQVKSLDVLTKEISMPAKEDLAPVTEGEGPRQNSKMCSICTEDFVEGRSVRILPCRHIYHRRCIDPWLLDFAGTCPLW